MKGSDYIYIGLFLVSIVLLFFAVKNYNKTKTLLANGIKTKAKVIDLIAISSDDGYTYKPVFEYTNKLDEVITFKSSVSSSPASYEVGEIVEIVYSKNSEERKVISFWGLYRWTIILSIFAFPLLIVGGGYLLYSRF